MAVASGGCYECADELGCVDDACDCACHTRELVDVAAAWELAA